GSGGGSSRLSSVNTPAGMDSLNNDVGPNSNHRSPSSMAFSTEALRTSAFAFGTCWPSVYPPLSTVTTLSPAKYALNSENVSSDLVYHNPGSIPLRSKRLGISASSAAVLNTTSISGSFRASSSGLDRHQVRTV